MPGIKDETFGGAYPFTPRFFDAGGFAMHYVDEGEGEPVLMLHGDPTWGYLWRKLIPSLSTKHRVIVPDHMGMGKSDAPEAPYPYLLRHHIANLESLVLSLGLSDITLIVHDWGGPVGLGFAARHPELIKRLVITNTWAFAKWPGLSRRNSAEPDAPFPKLIEMIRSPRGEQFVLEKNGYVARAMAGTVNYPEKLTTGVMDAYLAPFPTPESRRALLCWSRDIPVSEGDASWDDMKHIEENLHLFANVPVLIVWGMLDPVLPPSVLEMWKNVYPRARVVEIHDASHFLQEDAPDAVLGAIEEFLDE
ncbi:MAG: alpha/beta fold hydrolase [Candidatus Dadabacteria bacterium]|nr:MAG: alpha/beta fold hydrolase [Candidatus Dadabacteria bacterium]